MLRLSSLQQWLDTKSFWILQLYCGHSSLYMWTTNAPQYKGRECCADSELGILYYSVATTRTMLVYIINFCLRYLTHSYSWFTKLCGENNLSQGWLKNLIISDRIREKGLSSAKCDFLPFFKLSPFQGLKSPRLLAWFISSLGFRSNVRSLSKPPILSKEPPKQGTKWQFLNAINARTCPAHTENGHGSWFVASVAGW